MGKYRWSIRKWVEKEHHKAGFLYLFTDSRTKEVYLVKSTDRLSDKNGEMHMELR